MTTHDNRSFEAGSVTSGVTRNQRKKSVDTPAEMARQKADLLQLRHAVEQVRDGQRVLWACEGTPREIRAAIEASWKADDDALARHVAGGEGRPRRGRPANQWLTQIADFAETIRGNGRWTEQKRMTVYRQIDQWTAEWRLMNPTGKDADGPPTRYGGTWISSHKEDAAATASALGYILKAARKKKRAMMFRADRGHAAGVVLVLKSAG